MRKIVALLLTSVVLAGGVVSCGPGPAATSTFTPAPLSTPTPLPSAEEVLRRYDQLLPLVESLQAAQDAPPDLQLPPAADWQVVLLPLSDRLYYVQALLFPEWALGDPAAPAKLYVTYMCERGESLGWEVGVGFETAVDTQEVLVEVALVAEVEGGFYLLERREGAGGAEGEGCDGLVRQAVEPLEALGAQGQEVETALEAVVGYATGLDWDRLGFSLRAALLEWALSSPYWGDRVQAADTLGGMGAVAVPALVQALGDDNENVRVVSAIALGRIGPQAVEAAPSLIRSLQGGGVEVRRAAALALGRIGVGEGVVSALVQALADEEEIVRLAAAQALGQVGPWAAEAAFPLAQLLEDESEAVRAAAADALGRIGPDASAAVPALVRALEDESAGVREAAAWALEGIGPEAEEAVPALAQVLQDEGEVQGVREGAARALGRIGSGAEVAVDALAQVLGDEAWAMRSVAAEALGRIGPEAMEAVPALIQALGDENEDVRGAAARALASISGQGFGADAGRWREWWEQQR